jgi:hypothetical protein
MIHERACARLDILRCRDRTVCDALQAGRHPPSGASPTTVLGHLSRPASFLRPAVPRDSRRQPVGTGSAQIRWSIAPNKRRVR